MEIMQLRTQRNALYYYIATLRPYSGSRPHVAYSNRIPLSGMHRMVSGILLKKLGLNVVDAILVYCSPRLDAFLSTPSDLKVCGLTVHKLSDSLRIQMSGFAAKFAGCVWTEAVTSGKKKLRIKKKFRIRVDRGLSLNKSLK